MSTFKKLWPDQYITSFLVSGADRFDSVMADRLRGIGSFKDIQSKMDECAEILHENHIVRRAEQFCQYQSDNGLYYQQNLRKIEPRYTQFGTKVVYSEHPIDVVFTQQGTVVEVALAANTTYFLNNQVAHLINNKMRGELLFFCFHGSYPVAIRLYDAMPTPH